MATKARNKKLLGTTTELIRIVQTQIEKHRTRVIKGEVFFALSEEQIKKKLNRVNSPMIVSEAFTSEPPRGGTMNYSVSISNPDAVEREFLYAHVFVGTGNVVTDTGAFLLNVDPRFPRLMKPGVFGLSLPAGASETLEFTIRIPTVARTNYQGNTALIQLDFLDIGTYLDRAAFVFRVT